MSATILTRIRSIGSMCLMLTLCIWMSARAETVQELVDMVSAHHLSTHIAALEFPRASAEQLDLAADYITGQLESYGYAVSEQPVSYSKNLIARLEGTTPTELVFVVGAHYDTIADTPGADDNASGVAGVLEVARILAGRSLPYTVEFVAFSLEELWMVGSAHYVDQAQAEGKDIFGMVNFEMIGYTCDTPGCQNPFYDAPGCLEVEPDGINIGDFGAICVNDASAELLAEAILAVENYVPGFATLTLQVAANGDCFPYTRRSDHVPFWDAGIPAIEFFDTYGQRNPHYHTWYDSLSTLDMQFCRRNVQTGLVVALQHLGGAVTDGPATPSFAVLHNVAPSPFNPRTHVRFALSQAGPLALHIYDSEGRRVRTLADQHWGGGEYALEWNGEDNLGRSLPSGVYLIRLETQYGAQSRRVVLIR